MKLKFIFSLIEYLGKSTEFFWDFSKFLYFPPLVDIYRHPLLIHFYCKSNHLFSCTASRIDPTTSSSMSTSYYARSSSYVLPAPLDFQLHLRANCAQVCTNTPGSYSCSCVSGYRLASDGKSCLGKMPV